MTIGVPDDLLSAAAPAEIAVSEVVYREDLYPRLEKSWHRWTAHGLELSFGAAFPATCPSSLRDLLAGTIRDGVFIPVGSVARHYFSLERESRSAKPRHQHVYFIQSIHGGPVKIGRAEDVNARLRELQTAHPYPLKVLAVIPYGGKAMEQDLHERLAADRLTGEWFKDSSSLREVIHAA